ncbi:serine/threonine kinase [alpha proteobacterium U9-1i]|nr:serine/threonine kinase [alpha proteobacterium U9-1i]
MTEQRQESEERAVRLASIVSIDIVGFSTMSERNQRSAAQKVESLRVRIERTAGQHGGRLFNTAGDGFMLEFGSAGAALGAIQDILDKPARGEPKLRVGAHVGDVIVTNNEDLLGHGVNVAARLQELAEPGAALVSQEFRSMARNSPTAAFQARGKQPLDNIDQRVQTFEILSRRQKMARFMRRLGSWVVIALILGALVYFGPTLWRLAQPLIGSEEAVAPAAAEQTVAPPDVLEATSGAPARAAAGSVFTDCANCPEMVVLPGGLFVMGSPATERGRAADEGPTREVSIAPLAVSRTEITFAQWDTCLAGGGCNSFSPPDRGWGRGAQPVLGLSWEDAQAYLDWLNTQSGGLRYRLLSEAEWEYAARAGSRDAYAFGPNVSAQQVTFRVRAPTPVGIHAANAFGLQDMHGNVAEWVEDCYVANYSVAPIDGAAVAPTGNCARRVLRGGHFADQVAAVRSAARRSERPAARAPNAGFRVARTID